MALGMLLAVVTGGCGSGGNSDSDPELPVRTHEQVRDCLRQEGYTITSKPELGLEIFSPGPPKDWFKAAKGEIAVAVAYYATRTDAASVRTSLVDGVLIVAKEKAPKAKLTRAAIEEVVRTRGRVLYWWGFNGGWTARSLKEVEGCLEPA
jgi:hypothetical protein